MPTRHATHRAFAAPVLGLAALLALTAIPARAADEPAPSPPSSRFT